jgi:hypothetical protein
MSPSSQLFYLSHRNTPSFVTSHLDRGMSQAFIPLYPLDKQSLNVKYRGRIKNYFQDIIKFQPSYFESNSIFDLINAIGTQRGRVEIPKDLFQILLGKF